MTDAEVATLDSQKRSERRSTALVSLRAGLPALGGGQRTEQR
jgi:hypothetical protein